LHYVDSGRTPVVPGDLVLVQCLVEDQSLHLVHIASDQGGGGRGFPSDAMAEEKRRRPSAWMPVGPARVQQAHLPAWRYDAASDAPWGRAFERVIRQDGNNVDGNNAWQEGHHPALPCCLGILSTLVIRHHRRRCCLYLTLVIPPTVVFVPLRLPQARRRSEAGSSDLERGIRMRSHLHDGIKVRGASDNTDAEQ